MAGFATRGGTIRADLLHSIFELPLVRIQMATGARELTPVVGNCLRLEVIAFLVAIAARDRHMATGQNKLGLFVPRQRKG